MGNSGSQGEPSPLLRVSCWDRNLVWTGLGPENVWCLPVDVSADDLRARAMCLELSGRLSAYGCLRFLRCCVQAVRGSCSGAGRGNRAILNAEDPSIVPSPQWNPAAKRAYNT
jgi:hypothetical protein